MEDPNSLTIVTHQSQEDAQIPSPVLVIKSCVSFPEPVRVFLIMNWTNIVTQTSFWAFLRKIFQVALLTAVAGSHFACAPHQPHRLLDLTHAFGPETIYWPNNDAFQWEKTSWGPTEAGHWYASAKFSASEHGGTHLDAPIHFAKDRQTLDQIPLDRLVGPGIVIDVSQDCEKNADFQVPLEAIFHWESKYGKIEEGTIVLIRTGWGVKWSDAKSYLGTNDLQDPLSLHFPGLSPSAAEFLARKRQVRGVGIDTASIDHGQSRKFLAHQLLSQANVYALENVANLDRLPDKGFLISALPIKIKGGTGGPVRLIAQFP